MGGRVVSVTTDGFITDLDKLEDRILSLPPQDTTLLRLYRDLRIQLTSETNPDTGELLVESVQPNALEVKTVGKGIVS